MGFKAVKLAVVAAGFVAAALGAAPASASIFGSESGPAIALGAACAGRMEGIGRDPGEAPNLAPIYRGIADGILSRKYGPLRNVPQGIAAYTVARLDAIVRQPSNAADFAVAAKECAADLSTLKSWRPHRAALAIGEMCEQLLRTIGRQPNAETPLLAAYLEGLEQVEALRPRSSLKVKVEAIGMAGRGALVAAAFEPTIGDRLLELGEMCENDIRRN